ncbi:uncharacterized protein LOC134251086 [Saccostrea cucullata]|uniref:uncharacterized protein LOC134251086 n=1 Tax=Saccostrea cuccullata TaxID=36930 RepID=UPI002ED1A5B0
MDTLAGNRWFSKLDANAAYCQVKIAPEDRKKTAFITKYGLFEFTRMGFGLCNAPATFARAIKLVLHRLNWKIALAFLDDILVLGSSAQAHLDNLRQVFERFRAYGLKFKPRKCELFKTKVEFLGRTVSEHGVEMGDQYIESVRDWPVPRDVKGVERFLGFANYHRSFIPHFSRIAAPLYAVAGKNGFRWGEEQYNAFEELTQLMTKPPVLAIPNSTGHFILDTDASDYAVGGELSQVQGGKERTIGYGSAVLSAEQRRYCTTRKELLAVIKFTRQFRHYLLGREFTVRTDHHSLVWLMNFKHPKNQIARWLEELSQYNMRIVHRPGKKHVNADALSGDIPDSCQGYPTRIRVEDLPCGGCRYCRRAHERWHEFNTEIDDVIPLSQFFDETPVPAESPSAEGGNCDSLDPTLRQAIVSSSWEDTPLTVSASALPSFQINVSGVSSLDPKIETVSPQVCQLTGDTAGISLSSYSSADLAQKQENDEDIVYLRQYLESGVLPTESDLIIRSPEEKCYLLERDCFYLDETGVVWREPDDSDAPRRLLVPRSLRSEIMHLYHDIPSSDHQGIQRTKERLKQQFYWWRMTKDIKLYVTTCDVCARNKRGSLPNRSELKSYQAGSPMERVHLDFLGPLPRTDSGNEYILMMVDNFTKWVECIPLPSQTAEVTARSAINDFFSRFGYPYEIFTDQGRNFESELFYGQPKSWDKYLGPLAGALRSAVNRHTGYTPNRLMLGREVYIPATLMFAPPPSTSFQNGEEGEVDRYVRDLEENVQSAQDIARGKLIVAQKAMKRSHDIKVRTSKFKVGDLVYWRRNAGKKVESVWRGPGIIIEAKSDTISVVKSRREVKVMHHDKLKRCEFRQLPKWLINYKNKLPGQSVARDGDSSPIYDVVAPLGTADSGISPGSPWSGGHSKVSPKPAESVGPYMGTRKRVRERLDQSKQPQSPRRPRATRGTKTRKYYVCLQSNPKEIMVQFDNCRDWFHPGCVGISEDYAKSIPQYICPECSPVGVDTD